MLPCRVCDDGSHESRAERDSTRREREKEFVSGNGVVVVVAAAAATAGGSMYATVFRFLYATVFSFVLYASFCFFCKHPAFFLNFNFLAKVSRLGIFFPLKGLRILMRFFWYSSSQISTPSVFLFSKNRQISLLGSSKWPKL
jgi:hypothetical protein